MTLINKTPNASKYKQIYAKIAYHATEIRLRVRKLKLFYVRS